MRSELKISINTIDRVKRFVKIVSEYESDIDLGQGRYIIDAKSIMGIFSFDLTKVFTVKIHTIDINELKRFNEEMEEFKVDNRGN